MRASSADVELGHRMADLRKRAGLTQRQVAERFRIDKASVSEWERGQSKPDRDRLPELDRVYGAGGELLALFGFGPSATDPLEVRFTELAARVTQLEAVAGLRQQQVDDLTQEFDRLTATVNRFLEVRRRRHAQERQHDG